MTEEKKEKISDLSGRALLEAIIAKAISEEATKTKKYENQKQSGPCGAPKYPQIEVHLNGDSSWTIMGKIADALRANGISKAERDAFMKDVTASAHDVILATAKKWVTVK